MFYTCDILLRHKNKQKANKMKCLYRNLYRKEKGFSLVEIVIVIVILAILTGIAVPSYLVARNKAKIATAKAELMNIATALGVFEADWEVYPATANWIKELDGTIGATGINTEGYVYMKLVPTKDAWENDYVYGQPGDSTNPAGYSVRSLGEDGAAGGTGAGADIVVIDGQLQ